MINSMRSQKKQPLVCWEFLLIHRDFKRVTKMLRVITSACLMKWTLDLYLTLPKQNLVALARIS